MALGRRERERKRRVLSTLEANPRGTPWRLAKLFLEKWRRRSKRGAIGSHFFLSLARWKKKKFFSFPLSSLSLSRALLPVLLSPSRQARHLAPAHALHPRRDREHGCLGRSASLEDDDGDDEKIKHSLLLLLVFAPPPSSTPPPPPEEDRRRREGHPAAASRRPRRRRRRLRRPQRRRGRRRRRAEAAALRVLLGGLPLLEQRRRKRRKRRRRPDEEDEGGEQELHDEPAGEGRSRRPRRRPPCQAQPDLQQGPRREMEKERKKCFFFRFSFFRRSRSTSL